MCRKPKDPKEISLVHNTAVIQWLLLPGPNVVYPYCGEHMKDKHCSFIIKDLYVYVSRPMIFR